MLEKKYILNENPSVLDLRGIEDIKELRKIKKELQNRFDLINLWADFEEHHYLKSPLKEIHTLINRNNIKFLLKMLAMNSPDYYLFDFSYQAKNITTPKNRKTTLRQPYKLTEEDFTNLTEGLKVNTHIKILCLYNVDHIPARYFLALAEALKNSPVQAFYCSNTNLHSTDIQSIVDKLMKHPFLIQLTLSDSQQIFYQKNVQHHIDAIKKCKTLTELSDYLAKMEYLLLPAQILRSSSLIKKLAESDLKNIPKEYGLRYKVKILRELANRKKNQPFNTTSIMQSLPNANIASDTQPIDDLNHTLKTPEKRKNSSMETTKENLPVSVTAKDEPTWTTKMRKTK